MKASLLVAAEWVQAYWLALTSFLTILWSLFLFLLAGTWWVAFILNGAYGYHFELGSCWQGVTVAGTALVSIFGLAKASWTKYDTDSKQNTSQGQMPPVPECVKTILGGKT